MPSAVAAAPTRWSRDGCADFMDGGHRGTRRGCWARCAATTGPPSSRTGRTSRPRWRRTGLARGRALLDGGAEELLACCRPMLAGEAGVLEIHGYPIAANCTWTAGGCCSAVVLLPPHPGGAARPGAAAGAGLPGRRAAGPRPRRRRDSAGGAAPARWASSSATPARRCCGPSATAAPPVSWPAGPGSPWPPRASTPACCARRAAGHATCAATPSAHPHPAGRRPAEGRRGGLVVCPRGPRGAQRGPGPVRRRLGVIMHEVTNRRTFRPGGPPLRRGCWNDEPVRRGQRHLRPRRPRRRAAPLLHGRIRRPAHRAVLHRGRRDETWRSTCPGSPTSGSRPMFRTAGYRRDAFAPHAALHAARAMTAEDFGRWVQLWRAAVDGLYRGPNAERAKAEGERIALALHRRLAGPDPALLREAGRLGFVPLAALELRSTA